MKALSWILIALPTVLLPLALLFPEDTIGLVFAWSWIACTLCCLGWGYIAFPSHRRLAWVCIFVALLHVVLIILLPLVLPPGKTRSLLGTEPLAAPNAAIALQIHIWHHWPAASDEHRWARHE